MYFENRAQAGQILAAELLEKYRYEDCAVVALTDGAVIVGEQIATALHSILTMLLIENIEIPGEGMSFGGVSQNGAFTYNGMFSAGEIEQYTSEFHGYLEEQKRISFQKLNRLLGDGGLINNDMLRDRVVILVSDGLDSGASLDVAVDFLKPVRIKRLVVASPVATVQSVDKLHMLADELHILSVKDNYLGVDHYYNQNDIPSHEDTIAKINQIVLNWR
ncbi:MAG TPA: phosphoribosyltransferase family protein [Candidatus Saccharibacteria bacterium]|nr:phosphoribosyltransferase family protein [Candidatus Saccharibacteria bacterium]HRQ06939.1 phosphoribosyltransferase family protein [Candidatus Saccharibacteria bacterium]